MIGALQASVDNLSPHQVGPWQHAPNLCNQLSSQMTRLAVFDNNEATVTFGDNTIVADCRVIQLTGKNKDNTKAVEDVTQPVQYSFGRDTQYKDICVVRPSSTELQRI